MAEDKGTEPVDEGMEVVPDAPLADVPTIIPELEDVVSNLATDVSFARKTWKDGSEGATPITAAELNRLEKGVADLTSAVNALRDSDGHRLAVVDVDDQYVPHLRVDGGGRRGHPGYRRGRVLRAAVHVVVPPIDDPGHDHERAGELRLLGDRAGDPLCGAPAYLPSA